MGLAPGAVRFEASWSKGSIDGHPALVMTLTGHGLDSTSDDRDKFFEPFRKNRAGKASFGPAIAKRIVEAHDGTVSLSDGTGPGLTVLITLPLIPLKGAPRKPFAQKADGLAERRQTGREERMRRPGRSILPGEAG